jgi:hypothetical protein
MGSLSFEPLIGPAAWVTLALVGLAAMSWYAWHRPAACPAARWRAACALMFAGLAAALTILLNPTWIEPIPPPAGKPLLTVLVDSSASMATTDSSDGRTRYAAVAEAASQVAGELERQFEVRLRTFAAAPAAAGVDDLSRLAPDGQLTDLASALAQSLEGDRPQGQAVLVLSDGAHNAPGGAASVLEVARTARSMAAPVYTATIGGQAQPDDLELTLPRPQELAFVGQNVPLRVRLRQRGAVTDRAVVVVESDGQEIQRQEVAISPNGDADAVLHVQQAGSGLFQYDVRVEAAGRELTAANNRALFQLRVVNDPIRVLVLEGKPYWDSKFLLRTLTGDPSLEVDFVVRVASGRFLRRRVRIVQPEPGAAASDETGDVPVQREETVELLSDPLHGVIDAEALRGYQVLVLGRDAEVFLSGSAVEGIGRWVSRDGGSLVCYRGAPVANPDQQLSRLLPVRWAPGRESRFRIHVTERGENISWLAPVSPAPQALEKLPSLATVSSMQGVRPLAVVLGHTETGSDTPVLTYQPAGAGRVVAVEGAGMWRWAFLAPEYQQHDAVYGTLWQSLVRWLVSSVGLVPGQDLAFRVDRVSYQAGEPVSAVVLQRVAAPQQALSVELRQEGAADVQSFTPVPLGDEPGVFQVPFGALAEGRYTARITGNESDAADATTTVAFEVRPFYGEQLDVAARPDLMARIAQDSGGRAFDQVDPGALAAEFAEHIADTRPERVRRITAWDRWWVLVGVIGLWAGAWAIRRSSGLV